MFTCEKHIRVTYTHAIIFFKISLKNIIKLTKAQIDNVCYSHMLYIISIQNIYFFTLILGST